jgi:hypothetical protein
MHGDDKQGGKQEVGEIKQEIKQEVQQEAEAELEYRGFRERTGPCKQETKREITIDPATAVSKRARSRPNSLDSWRQSLKAGDMVKERFTHEGHPTWFHGRVVKVYTSSAAVAPSFFDVSYTDGDRESRRPAHVLHLPDDEAICPVPQPFGDEPAPADDPPADDALPAPPALARQLENADLMSADASGST